MIVIYQVLFIQWKYSIVFAQFGWIQFVSYHQNECEVKKENDELFSCMYTVKPQ